MSKKPSSRARNKQVSESPDFLHQVYENVAVGLCYFDTQLRFQHINEWLAALNGLPIEAHLGRTVREVLPVVADGVESQLRQVIETGEPIQGLVEAETPTKPGVLRIFSHDYYAAKAEDGAVVGVSCFVQDVTERKHAEYRARKEERELYEALFQESPGMYIVTRDRRGGPVIERCNARFLHTLGWTNDEVIGRPLADFYAPTSRERLESYGYQQALRGRLIDEERELVTRDGRVITTIIHAVPVTDCDGNVTGTRGLFTDITERKRAEEQVAFQASLLEQVHNGVIAVDSDNKITYWNKYAEELYQWKSEEALGKSIVELLSPEKMKSIAMHNIAVLHREGHWEGEFNVKRKNGTTIPAFIINTILKDASGKNIGILGISADITDRKRAEEALRQSHADLRSLAARLHDIREEERAKMARTVHDELGQTMTALKMDLSWLRRHLPDDDTSLQQLTDSMVETCDATIARVCTMAEELRPPGLDQLGLTAAIEWEVRKFEQRNGISCELDCSIEDTEVDQNLSMATFRILQEALINVARHAEATRVEVRLEQTDGTLVLSVQDYGRGFADLGSAARSLGIVGMQERAIARGGELTIENVSEKGARVTLRVPLPETGVATEPPGVS